MIKLPFHDQADPPVWYKRLSQTEADEVERVEATVGIYLFGGRPGPRGYVFGARGKYLVRSFGGTAVITPLEPVGEPIPIEGEAVLELQGIYRVSADFSVLVLIDPYKEQS